MSVQMRGEHITNVQANDDFFQRLFEERKKRNEIVCQLDYAPQQIRNNNNNKMYRILNRDCDVIGELLRKKYHTFEMHYFFATIFPFQAKGGKQYFGIYTKNSRMVAGVEQSKKKHT